MYHNMSEENKQRLKKYKKFIMNERNQNKVFYAI